MLGAEISNKLLITRLKTEAKLIRAHPVEANVVFIALPENLIQSLRERGWVFYNFIGSGVVRFMCSWQTTEADIDALVADAVALQTLIGG
jgi:threonine aldolase